MRSLLPLPFSLSTSHHNKIRSSSSQRPTSINQPPKSSRARSYPSNQLPIVQESITLSRNVDNFPSNPSSSSVKPTTTRQYQSCLLSWRKFLTPSTTLLPLLATPPFPTSLQTLPTNPPMLLTRQFWPALQRVADSTSETSHTQRPRGSCNPSSRDT